MKKRKTSERAKLERECDKLWSEAIRLRDKACRYPDCKKRKIQAHHIFTRKYRSVRWELLNGVGLCAGHHLFWAHTEPEKFRDYILAKLGVDQFEALKQRAYQPAKYSIDDLQVIKASLQASIKQLSKQKKSPA